MNNESILRRRFAFIDFLFGEKNLDALLISRRTHIRYITGFSGSNALLLATRGGLYLITDTRYENQASKEVSNSKIVIAKRGLADEIKKRRYLLNTGRVGFESGYLSYNEYRYIKTLFPDKKWVALKTTLEPLMLRKEEYEIENIRKAVSVSERVFGDIFKLVKPGVEEKEIAAEISYLHKKYGAECDAFEPIVTSGKRSSLVHGRASEKKIRKNEPIIIDFGCVVNGYHSDITRMIFVGRVSREIAKCYSIVSDALERSTEAVREDIICSKLDAIARNIFKKAGYGGYFSHSLGHGIGLEIHEQPRISVYSNERLVADATITIEPGLYIPDSFGIRIEDDILVTEKGYERLTALPRELMQV